MLQTLDPSQIALKLVQRWYSSTPKVLCFNQNAVKQLVKRNRLLPIPQRGYTTADGKQSDEDFLDFSRAAVMMAAAEDGLLIDCSIQISSSAGIFPPPTSMSLGHHDL